jgi:hypothetical protein
MLAALRDCTYNLARAIGAFEPRSQPETYVNHFAAS